MTTLEYTPKDTSFKNEEIIADTREIANQNSRYERTAEIGTEAIRLATRAGIHDEQVDSFSTLLGHAKNIPYESMGVYAGQLEAEVRNLERQQRLTEELLEQDRALALQLTTRRADEVDQAYQEAVAASKSQRVEEARTELENVYRQIELLGTAWPVPHAISPNERNALYGESMNAEDEFGTIVDIIPVTPLEKERMCELADKARYQIDNPDLSQHVLFYLTEEKGKTVTVDDLIQFCYSVEGSNGECNYRSRITTTLGPKIEGKKKQHELSKEGLKLQYGVRIVYGTNAEGMTVIKRRTRIYRVVDAGNEYPDVIVNEKGNFRIEDQWQEIGHLAANITDDSSGDSLDAVAEVYADNDTGDSDHWMEDDTAYEDLLSSPNRVRTAKGSVKPGPERFDTKKPRKGHRPQGLRYGKKSGKNIYKA